MADTTIFSTSIYGISVTFADVITSDTPIIIDNDVIALYGCLVLIWKLQILAHNAMFGFRHLRSYMLPHPLCGLDKLLTRGEPNTENFMQ